MKGVNGHVFECCKDQLCNVDQTGNRVSCITEVLEDICGKVSGKGREEEDSVAGQITVLIIALLIVILFITIKILKHRRQNRRMKRIARRVVEREMEETSV